VRAAIVLQKPARLLRHLFYFIARKSELQYNKYCNKIKQTFILLQHFVLLRIEMIA